MTKYGPEPDVTVSHDAEDSSGEQSQDSPTQDSGSEPPIGPEPDPATEPESSPSAESEADNESESPPEAKETEAHTPSSHGIANPPDIGASPTGPQVSAADTSSSPADTSPPSNESGSCRKAQSKQESDASESDDSSDTSTETVLSGMADGRTEAPRGDGGSSGGGSGVIFDDTDVTKWGFLAFMGFEGICATFAALVLYAISNHGVHHAPWFLWTILGVLIFAFLAAAFGGLAAAKSMVDAAGGLASESQSQNSEHR